MNPDLTARTTPAGAQERARAYLLLDALTHRRSRRFGLGMKLNGGPLAYESAHQAQPLTVDEEAALAFAACGVTGYALAELPYESGATSDAGGGNIMKQFVGRTAPSADALHAVTVFVINDGGAWMLRRPQDYPLADVPGLIKAAREHKLTESLPAKPDAHRRPARGRAARAAVRAAVQQVVRQRSGQHLLYPRERTDVALP